MMRNWDSGKKDLYNRYYDVGREIALCTANQQESDINNKIWSLLVDSDIWRLPVDEKYDGLGLGWQEYMIALDGLISSYQDFELISIIISHTSAVYLIHQYGSEQNKKKYLPKIMADGMACVLFENLINQIQLSRYQSNILKNNIKNISIKFKKNSSLLLINKISNNNENEIYLIDFLNDKDKKIQHDFLNFQRIFYGYFAIQSSFKNIKNIFQEDTHNSNFH